MKPILLTGLLVLLLTKGCDSPTAMHPDEPTHPLEQSLTEEEHARLNEEGIAAGKRGFFFSIARAPVLTFSEEDRVGRSRMIRFDGGVLATVQTSSLEPGTATTLWMVVFNAPEHCSGGDCGSDDLRNPDVRADLLWVDGQVIGPSGRARYFVFKREGDTAGSIADPFLSAPAYGVEDAHETEIHYVVRTHGPVIPGLDHDMTHSFNGGCQLGSLPDDPRLGEPGPNTCANLQFAVHLP
jgi:hypothetical protein